MIKGFENDTNNTDIVDESMKKMEDSLDGQRMPFVTTYESTMTVGAYQHENWCVFSILRGRKPTLLFRNDDSVN